MKTLKESLLDIDRTIERSSEAAAEEGIRIFIKKLFKNGFPHNPREMDGTEFEVESGRKGYTVKFTNAFRRTVLIDEGYTIPEDLIEIRANNGSLDYVCNGKRADCSVLSIITTLNNNFELIAMQDEVTWANFDTKKMKQVPDKVKFESGLTFGDTVEHKFENCNFRGIKNIVYDDADLRNTTEPVPGCTATTTITVMLNDCIIGKNTSYELIKAGIEGLNWHLEFTKDRCIIPEYGDEIRLYNMFFQSGVVNGIKAKYVRGVHVDNLHLVDPSAEVIEVHTSGTVNIKKSPLSFVPKTFLLNDNSGNSASVSHKIVALDIDCEKFVDQFYQSDLKTFSSKSCKYIDATADTKLSKIIAKIIDSQPSSYKDLDDIVNIKKLPSLKYLSFAYHGSVLVLEKLEKNLFWTVMNKSDAAKVQNEYLAALD